MAPLMTKRALLITGAVLLAVLIGYNAAKATRIDPLPAATKLLADAEIPVPPYLIRTLDVRPVQASREAAAFVYEDDDTIFILTDTVIWDDASYGDETALKNLAAIIVHEGVHASGNPSEKDAYDAQIDALERLNAPQNLIDGVRKAEEDKLR
jgi:hypothetical protein